MIEDAFSIITEEIEKIDGRKKHTSTNVFICCPFHDEKTPSLSINMSQDAKVNVGTFMCFGCPEKGPWNLLAKKLGLREVKEWQHFQGSSDTAVNKLRKAKKDFARFNSYSIDRLFEELGGAVLPWPKEKEWRDYPGAMIHRVDGYMYNDERRDELMLALPIYINGRYRGGVKALWEKPKDGPSYINTSGDWVMNYGLLGYDFINKHELWGCTSMVLVEGPRDWLRMVLNKIPACGILGSKMFNEKKLMLLMSFGIKKIYTLADNDKAGTSMVRLIEKVCRGYIEVEELKLPRKLDDEGKLIKMDPDNAPQKIIDKVKALVYEGRTVPKKSVTDGKKKRA